MSGFCGFIAFPLLFTLGVSLTSANHATMILAILPVLTGAIALAWDRQKPKSSWWLGCALAFGGEVLLIYDPETDSARGTTFWGVSLFAMLLLPVAPLVLDFDALAHAGSYAWSGLIYQAIGVTIVAYVLWYWALGTGGIARVGLFQFLQPVSGVILATFILSEQLSLMFLLASAIIMIGVILAFRAN